MSAMINTKAQTTGILNDSMIPSIAILGEISAA